MSKNIKEDLLQNYIQLAKTLGKLPSWTDCKKFNISNDKIVHHYGNITELKELALSQCPELESTKIVPQLSYDHISNYRFGVEISKNKKSNKKLVEDFSTLDYIAQYAEKVFSGKVKSNNLKPKNFKIKRIHVLQLSDLHFGADLNGDETGVSDFKVKEESRRFAAVIKQTAEYKSQYRKTTKLRIVLNGDMIENQLHDPRTGVVKAEQVCRAIHYLSQGISYLSNHYPEVEVDCSTGNHDRDTARHQSRAVHQKFDSLSTIIYYSTKSALKNVKNIKFNIPKTPLGSFIEFGYRYGYTHGDTVLKVGNPYVAVNVKNLETQVNKINASLPDKDEYKVIMYGHTHLAHVVQLPNGCTLVGNGGLPPSDHFGVSLGNFETNNNQVIFEAVEGHPVGDIRFIKCGKDYDKDNSLDKIIVPWSNF